MVVVMTGANVTIGRFLVRRLVVLLVGGSFVDIRSEGRSSTLVTIPCGSGIGSCKRGSWRWLTARHDGWLHPRMVMRIGRVRVSSSTWRGKAIVGDGSYFWWRAVTTAERWHRTRSPVQGAVERRRYGGCRSTVVRVSDAVGLRCWLGRQMLHRLRRSLGVTRI